jgi:hypothetical protein
MASSEPPPPELWALFRSSYAALHEQTLAAAEAIAASKLRDQRVAEAVTAFGVAPELIDAYVKVCELALSRVCTAEQVKLQETDSVVFCFMCLTYHFSLCSLRVVKPGWSGCCCSCWRKHGCSAASALGNSRCKERSKHVFSGSSMLRV